MGPAGSVVPADGVVLTARDFFVNQSVLTGETFPVEKKPSPVEADAALSERLNMVFMGTSARSGTARALIVETGTRTEYGRIAERLTLRPPETEFERGIRRFGQLLTKIMTVLVLAVFVVNVVLRKPPIDSLLFAIALAVGLTPELLPAIVTLNLTRGARALSGGGVLVKRLPAIQNLGGVTVLCTDKTGTLTTGTLEVVRSVGIDRDDLAEAARALEFAYLNSHFQTGFTNPLDAAILAGVPEPADLVAYTKRAELPYDFTRRLLSVVVHKEDEVPLLITKGAPEALLLRASRVRGESSVRPIGPEEHERLARLVAGVSAEGYRLVAVGSRALTAEEGVRVDSAGRLPPLDPRTVETDLVFEGLVLFSDPPKAGVEETIAQLARDRVALKVVTGDNDLVARHVAGQVGLAVDDILTGDGRVDIEDLRWEYLQGDGDFRSTEVTQLRDQADIIITNPPFSLFREYVAWLIEGGTKFAALGNMNAITYKEVFPSIRDNRLWLGASHFNTGMYFGVSDAFEYAESYKFERERGGMMVARVPGICWFTNIDHGRRHEPLQLMTVADNIRFSKHKEVREVGYRSYDNYDALEVPFTDAIPSDYDDVMGVPITFLDKFNPDQFEIVGRGEDIEWAKSEDCTFFTPTTPELQKLHRQRDKTWRIQNPYLLDANGFARTVYKRIFIRHLTPMPKKG